MENLLIFLAVIAAFVIIYFFLSVLGKKNPAEEKKEKERDIVVALEIEYMKEDDVFFCEFYLRDVRRYGYLEELETPEMEEQVKKGENPDLKLECYLEGFEGGIFGRWLVTTVNVVSGEE